MPFGLDHQSDMVYIRILRAFLLHIIAADPVIPDMQFIGNPL